MHSSGPPGCGCLKYYTFVPDLEPFNTNWKNAVVLPLATATSNKIHAFEGTCVQEFTPRGLKASD